MGGLLLIPWRFMGGILGVESVGEYGIGNGKLVMRVIRNAEGCFCGVGLVGKACFALLWRLKGDVGSWMDTQIDEEGFKEIRALEIMPSCP